MKPSPQHQSNSNNINSQTASEDGRKWVQMEHCSCQRNIQVNEVNDEESIIPYNDTTCSTDAYERGKGQKVIGFSFYGDINTDYSKKKGYFEGMHQIELKNLFVTSCPLWQNSNFIFKRVVLLLLYK